MSMPSHIGNRAGSYVLQPTGYHAFMPAPLPPDPSLRLVDKLQTLLSKADIALGRLDGSIQILPDPEIFVLMYVRKEAVLSSQIEGTQSSLQDVLNAEARIFSDRSSQDAYEVINYITAMNYGIERLQTLPLSIRLIREIHERLLKRVRGSHLTPGELRTSQNWIGPAGCAINEAVFVPPPHNELHNVLGQLENFLHSELDIPPLIRIGLAHAQFETIHPFLDGNGRMGRLLITFLLYQQKILQQPVLYLSHFFKKHRTEYYERLQLIRDTGDWESWMEFFLTGVAEVSNEAIVTARRILGLREEHRAVIAAELGSSAGGGHMVLEHLYKQPVLSVKDVQKITDVSYTTANNLVYGLVTNGILEEITGRRRNRLFRYAPYIDIFNEDTE